MKIIIRDRGKMKWTAFMMPEHVSMIKRFVEDDQKKIKPKLDEQELEDISIIVMESLHYTLPVKITIWRKGYFYHQTGTVNKL